MEALHSSFDNSWSTFQFLLPVFVIREPSHTKLDATLYSWMFCSLRLVSRSALQLSCSILTMMFRSSFALLVVLSAYLKLGSLFPSTFPLLENSLHYMFAVNVKKLRRKVHPCLAPAWILNFSDSRCSILTVGNDCLQDVLGFPSPLGIIRALPSLAMSNALQCTKQRYNGT